MLNFILKKQIIAPICIIVGTISIYFIATKIVKRILKIKVKKVDSKKQKTLTVLINNIIKYFLGAIALLMILEVYGIDTKSLIASLGVFGLVIGLALQDILKDLIAGMSIILENQYQLGDIVTINGFKGEVIFLGIKTTKIKAYTGEIKMISNRTITEVINHTLDNSLAIVDVGVNYDSDLNKVEKVLTKLCEDLTQNLEYLKGEVTLLGLDKMADSSLVYRISAETEPMKQFVVQRQINRAIVDAFNKNKINIPYNQVVIHNE